MDTQMMTSFESTSEFCHIPSNLLIEELVTFSRVRRVPPSVVYARASRDQSDYCNSN